jgi:hypothetical protein
MKKKVALHLSKSGHPTFPIDRSGVRFNHRVSLLRSKLGRTSTVNCLRYLTRHIAYQDNHRIFYKIRNSRVGSCDDVEIKLYLLPPRNPDAMRERTATIAPHAALSLLYQPPSRRYCIHLRPHRIANFTVINQPMVFRTSGILEYANDLEYLRAEAQSRSEFFATRATGRWEQYRKPAKLARTTGNPC